MSAIAARSLAALGYPDIVELKGSMQARQASGRPMSGPQPERRLTLTMVKRTPTVRDHPAALGDVPPEMVTDRSLAGTGTGRFDASAAGKRRRYRRHQRAGHR